MNYFSITRWKGSFTDFYDIWLLSRQFSFYGTELATAIRLTFERRGTKLTSDIEAFTSSFVESKQIQWTAFRKRLQQEHIPDSFAEITAAIAEFLNPMIDSLISGIQFQSQWSAPGPWKNN